MSCPLRCPGEAAAQARPEVGLGVPSDPSCIVFRVLGASSLAVSGGLGLVVGLFFDRSGDRRGGRRWSVPSLIL